MSRFEWLLCALGGLGITAVAYLTSIDAIGDEDAWAAVLLIVIAIGLGWLRIRKERRANSAHEAEVNSVQAMKWGAEKARRIRRGNHSRRLLIAFAFVFVGLALSFLDRDRVIQGTTIPVGYALAGFGVVVAVASILRVNIFRGGPYDIRLDPPVDDKVS